MHIAKNNKILIDNTLYPYIGCLNNCLYCIGRNKVLDFEFDNVLVDLKAIDNLKLLLDENKKVLTFNKNSDCYNIYEEKYEITRNILKLLDEKEYGIIIKTTSNLIKRDIDILKSINNKAKTSIIVPLVSIDDDINKLITPKLSLFNERIKLIEYLIEEKLNVFIEIAPIIPFVNDNLDNFKRLINKIKLINPKGVIIDRNGLYLDGNCKDYFEKIIKQKRAVLLEIYKDRFGKKKIIKREEIIKAIDTILQDSLIDTNILYDNDDINNFMNTIKVEYEQLSLFDF